MFELQKKLDESRSYARIIGTTHNNACYEQDGIEFNQQKKRITAYTPEEQEAVEAFEALREKREAAETKNIVAVKATAETASAEAAEAEANKPVEEPNPDMPNFDSGWTKAMLLTHATNKFSITLDPAAHHRTLVAQCKALYK